MEERLIVIGGLRLPAAVIVFPLTYIIGDVITEVLQEAMLNPCLDPEIMNQ